MATQPATPESLQEMVIKLRANKLIIDLDETTHSAILNLIELTEFDAPTVIKTILHRGIQQTSDAARAYRDETETARSKFIDTVLPPAVPTPEPEPTDNGTEHPDPNNGTDPEPEE